VEAMKDGYTDLPPGKLANVVTYLEMRTPPPWVGAASTTLSEFIIREARPEVESYRRLFRRIGEPWLWGSRLHMSDEELRAILQHPEIDIYVLSHSGVDGGLLEFDRRQMPDVEISFFGIVPELFGKGAGRALLEYCLRLAWAHQPNRIWLHTCTLDHPRALQFYRKAGFVPYKRAIEIMDDPRLTGDLPRDAAPDVPIL